MGTKKRELNARLPQTHLPRTLPPHRETITSTMATVGMTRPAAARVSCNRQTCRVVVTRASNAKQGKTQESRRAFARNAAMIAAAAVFSVVKSPAQAEEIPEKLKKKICANNATAKICIK